MRRPSALPLVAAALLALAIAGCAAGHRGVSPRSAAEPARRSEVGVASYYASRFHGRRTASGERYDEHELTAAHRTLPFGTRIQVTRLDRARQVIVRINDRGPHKRSRIVDLSLAAARELDLVRDGLARVRVEILEPAASR